MNIIILTPVYNDWQSFAHLTSEIKQILNSNDIHLTDIVCVNDNSSEEYSQADFALTTPVTLINLNMNLGHQRAIAVGLSYINNTYTNFDNIVVMDCDGEDNPAYIPEMCMKAVETKKIIFARRKKRTENLSFRIYYFIYKKLFYLLTNERINFGNFSCIPRNSVKPVILLPELWNNYTACIIKAKLPNVSIPANRGKRYFGKSKMNTQSLFLHGLSAISVYLDTVIIKILTYVFAGILLIILGVLSVIVIRIFTTLAIPGWASNVVLALINTGSTLFMVSLILLLLQLNQRSNRSVSVSNFYRDYILSIEPINHDKGGV